MAQIGKSGRERYYFEKFRLQASLPDGEITFGDKPDVIMTGARTLGIDLTHFYLEEGKNLASEQVQRGFRADVLAQAERIYKNEYGSTAGVTLGFDKSIPIRKSRKEKAALARRISKMIRTLSCRETYAHCPAGKLEKCIAISFKRSCRSLHLCTSIRVRMMTENGDFSNSTMVA